MSQPVGHMPTQSYGRTDDGRMIYCRCRHGELTIHVADDANGHALDGPEVYRADATHWVETDEEWRAMLSPALDLPEQFTPYTADDDPR